MKKTLIGLALAAATIASAPAAMIWTTPGATSAVTGACTYDFDGTSCPGVEYVTGAGNVTTGSESGVTAQPIGSTGNYLSIGPTRGDSVSVTITGLNYNYFGMLAGSLDDFNSIEFTLVDHTILTFTGEQLAAAAHYTATGDQQQSAYWNIRLDSDLRYTQIRLISSSNAFESDNHAFADAQVPVPATLALLAVGLAAFGSTRRRS